MKKSIAIAIILLGVLQLITIGLIVFPAEKTETTVKAEAKSAQVDTSGYVKQIKSLQSKVYSAQKGMNAVRMERDSALGESIRKEGVIDWKNQVIGNLEWDLLVWKTNAEKYRDSL